MDHGCALGPLRAGPHGVLTQVIGGPFTERSATPFCGPVPIVLVRGPKVHPFEAPTMLHLFGPLEDSHQDRSLAISLVIIAIDFKDVVAGRLEPFVFAIARATPSRRHPFDAYHNSLKPKAAAC